MIKTIYTNTDRQVSKEKHKENLLTYLQDGEKGPCAGSNPTKVLPVCYRCTRVPKNGLYDGFRIKGMFFCSDCQQELFTAEQDSPEYHEFLFLIQGTLL